ncbi:hypothetical protein GS421_15450 [Rhodococcus hoagii]|nr:hypothetical protein [Prescottella equi]
MIARMASLVEVVVDPALEAGFPAVRRSGLTVTMADGRVLDSGLRAAAGDADDPCWEDVVRPSFPPSPMNTGPPSTPSHGLSRPAT